jgi:hypothetical protein
MIFCIVTLHLWGILFRKYPELRGLAYADDGNAVGRLSLALQFLCEGQTLFKEDGNLDFNMGKTKFLAKGPIPLGICTNGPSIFFGPSLLFSTWPESLRKRCSL